MISKIKQHYPGNIRDLVYRGFLTLPIKIGQTQIVLKTLSEQEVQLAKFYSFNDNAKFTTLNLLLSLFAINGENLLPYREDLLQLGVIGDSFPIGFVKLLSLVAYLRRWYEYEFHYIYRFSLEDESMIRWNSVKDVSLNDPKITMIEGTQYLGLNDHQMLR